MEIKIWSFCHRCCQVMEMNVKYVFHICFASSRLSSASLKNLKAFLIFCFFPLLVAFSSVFFFPSLLKRIKFSAVRNLQNYLVSETEDVIMASAAHQCGPRSRQHQLVDSLRDRKNLVRGRNVIIGRMGSGGRHVGCLLSFDITLIFHLKYTLTGIDG